MSKLVLTGGYVIDGTGAPMRRSDIALEDGSIALIGEPGTVDTVGAECIDVGGQAIAPGFIDVHTHLDAQVFWDSACTPVPFQGVTTVIGGNCGFSVSPLGLDDEDRDYVIRMLANVEEIPLETLYQAVPWDWNSTSEYLDRVESTHPSINVGFLVGHSALRSAVMRHNAGEAASVEQIRVMKDMLREGLDAGALGFSTSMGPSHRDGNGDPVPSVSASMDELLALSGVVSEFEGTSLQFIGTQTMTDSEIMTKMALTAQRSLNWNLYIPLATSLSSELASMGDQAAKQGAAVYALAYPGLIKLMLHFEKSGRLARLPGWNKFMALSNTEKVFILADPLKRAELGALAALPHDSGQTNDIADWAKLLVAVGFSEKTRGLVGRYVADIALEQRSEPFDVVCDMLVADDLRTRFWPEPIGDTTADWEARIAAWSNPNVVLGGSDAGAHLNTITTYDWAPELLATNRSRGAMTLEQAVHRATGVQADLYGLKDRGRIAPRYRGDFVVFDPETIAPGPIRTLADLPGGAERLSSSALGISRVIVNGVEVVREGALTGAQPGHTLRSGRDTVTASGGLK